LNRYAEVPFPHPRISVRFEALGWILAAISVYAFVVFFSLLKARVIDYSPFDIALGVAAGLLVFGLIVTFLAGAVIITHEAADRQHQPWL